MRKSLIFGVTLLGGCALTGNPAVDLNAFGNQVSSFNTAFAAKAAVFNAKVVATVVPAGKAACGLASEADGFFKSAVGQIGVQVGTSASGGNATDVAAINASEAATFATVQQQCAIVDAMDPANPTATEVAAVQDLIANVPQIQADIAKVSPTAAALIKPAT